MFGPKGRPPPRDSNEAIVKRLLKQLPHADPSLSGKDPAAPKPSPTRSLGPRPGPPPPPPPNVRGAWWRAVASVVVATAVPFWPYAIACGFPLWGYMAAVTLVLVTGLWAAHFAWRERTGVPHVIALFVTVWGGVLAAERVLPRVGYARAEATWRCIADAPPVETPLPTAAPVIVTDTLLVEPDSAGPVDTIPPTP